MPDLFLHMTRTVNIRQLSELPATGMDLIRANPRTRIFAFEGNMGAGKTTFIKTLCDVLGVLDPTGSPTYSLVNEYKGQMGVTIYHFDFYRINNLEEVLAIGFEEYLESGAYCFIEWPEMVASLLPPDCLKVTIEQKGEERIITFPISG
jgi:tRNA threonylcarbamoyladenosine biosynthesis protein TsaE